MPSLRKILIVDDNKVNRRILMKILSNEYEVLEAENGKEALEILYEAWESISAVLLDIVMPVMNGYEVLKKMHSDTILSQIPVIVTTGNDDENAEVKTLSLGANDFLTKPYKSAIIKHRLQNTINLRETSAFVNTIEKDELTGLYSKEFFYKRATTIIKENTNKKYDIVCSDIERFKLINDIFGMKVGNELLKYVANLLIGYVSDDGICGRVGSDKFACLITHQENYEKFDFEGIMKSINEFPITMSLNISFGIYNVDELSAPVNVMCDRALIACNSVKGKYHIHYAYYDDKLRQNLLAEQMIIDSMNTAIKEKQFEVYFQPKCNLKNEEIVGAEALVRWNHPICGFMAPDEFIPIFERNGFITTLDLYVVDRTCEIIRSWIDGGRKVIPVSVNLSRVDIFNENLSQTLFDILEKYDLNPTHIRLEITESAYTDNPKQFIAAINKLRKLGFAIEMDDFGSGYSSLNMLDELSIDTLKLDMRFLQKQAEQKRDKNIVAFIIGLAKWLGLSVVAEGVETKEHVEFLSTLNCDLGQGYYFAKPLPKEEFEEYLKHSSPKAEKHIDFEPLLTIEEIWNPLSRFNKIFNSNMAILSIQKLQNDSITLIRGNKRFLSAFNLPENTLYKADKDISYDVFSDDRERYIKIMRNAKNGSGTYEVEISVHDYTNYKRIWRVTIRGYLISSESDTSIFICSHDNIRQISKHNENMQELYEAAYHDYLTGLYNRRAFEKLFFENYSCKKPHLALYVIDIDYFKKFNDTYGHSCGDDVLRLCSKVFRDFTRTDDIVARFGGDEFIILTSNIASYNFAIEKGKHLCEEIKRISEIQLGITITCSIGVTVDMNDEKQLDQLLSKADAALFQAKKAGKNTCSLYKD